MKLVAQGRRGEIRLDEENKIAIKKAKDKNKIAAINKERQILLKLKENNINFVPQIIDRGEGWFSYRWIEGITMYEILKKITESEKKINNKKGLNITKNKNHLSLSFLYPSPFLKKKLFTDLLEKAYILDSIGIIHGELIRPYKNIIINSIKEKNINLYIIDFERGKIGDYSGKNMRSYAQFLLSQKILTLEDVKKIGKLNKDEIFEFLKEKIERS